MAYKRKYKKGKRVESVSHFIQRCENRQHFYFLHKFLHYGFIMNWSIWYIHVQIKRGYIYEALEIKKISYKESV